mgnify:CR=1 FL=1
MVGVLTLHWFARYSFARCFPQGFHGLFLHLDRRPAYPAGAARNATLEVNTVSLFRTFVLLLAIGATPAWSASFSLVAKPGQFDARTLAAPSATVTFSGTAKLVTFAGSPQWPTASYIGIQEGPDRTNSLQVLAIRNRSTDDSLVIGYRLVVGGKEVKVESIANIPLHAVWKVRIRFDRGVAHLQVNGTHTVELRTPFKQAAPYVSVSSGEAEFAVDL